MTTEVQLVKMRGLSTVQPKGSCWTCAAGGATSPGKYRKPFGDHLCGPCWGRWSYENPISSGRDL